MNFLAFDPGTATGWALKRENGEVHYGTWRLKKSTEKVPQGELYLRLWREIIAVMKRFDIDPWELSIAVEAPSINAVGNTDSKSLNERWGCVVHTIGAFKGVHHVSEPTVNSWRSAFIGRAVAPKEIKGDKARRAWIKNAVIRACETRGLSPANDNEADALGVLFWVCNGGASVLEQRKADKKAKTAAKRAQGKLL